MDHRPDRRRHPRAFADFDVAIGNSLVTARDVSRSGLRCVVDEPIREMTEVEMTLQVPQPTGPTVRVVGRGAVVRVDRTADGRFELAILFLELDDAGGDAIDAYVTARAGQPTGS